MDPTVYDYIVECTAYEQAIDVHKDLYVKPKNKIFVRHFVATRKQQSGENLDEFMQALKQLAKDCNLKSVTANQYKEEAMRDAFINRLQTNPILQRLLENKVLELQAAYGQARALDITQKSSATFSQFATPVAATNLSVNTSKRLDSERQTDYSAATRPSCYFCGNFRHPRRNYPARDM